MKYSFLNISAAMALTCVVAVGCADSGAYSDFPSGDSVAFHEFVDDAVADGGSVPFGFVYGGKSVGGHLGATWIETTERSASESGETVVRTFRNDSSGLSVVYEMRLFSRFPAVEAVMWLRNDGADTTALIEDIHVLQHAFPVAGCPNLHYNKGGRSGIDEFAPSTVALADSAVRMGSYWGGFPTADFLPFFNLEHGDSVSASGLIVAVGWPARWEVEFLASGDSAVDVSVGQLRTGLRLAPGESVRTPRVVLMFWKGDRDEAQNMWRAWMLAHNTPHPDGKEPGTMLEAASSPFFAEMFHAHDYDQMEFIDGYADNGVKLDYWWMDAGWYPNKGGSWQDLLGSWWPDTLRYPNGLKAISDHAARRGHKTMLWFEPERVTADSWLWDNHPEWLLKVDHAGWPGFFNYGNPDARRWMLNRVDSILTTEGISLYRQDFAVMSGEYWDTQDSIRPDRVGMAENLHAVGYLEYIDSLLARHPAMLMDICAAGGKRLELENLRRAVPLWRSDYAFEPVGVQGQTMGISPWIPYSGAGVNAVTDYAFRSNMSPSIVLNLDARKTDLDWPRLRKLIEQWREIGGAYKGNYYPLTPYSLSPDAWVGWMFVNPAENQGFVQVFRRSDSPVETTVFRLRGLDPDRTYSVTDIDTGVTSTHTGHRLMTDGLTVTLPSPATAALLRLH